MTCKKAQGFLGHESVSVTETVDANRVRFDKNAAMQLLDGVEKLVAARGKKITVFDLKKDRPDDATLLGLLMGPTGNLRAPTARVGKILVVGFNEEAYKEVLGA